MGVLSQIQQYQQPPAPHAPTACPTCTGPSWWRDPYGTWRCEVCQPPLVAAMVRQRVGPATNHSSAHRTAAATPLGDAPRVAWTHPMAGTEGLLAEEEVAWPEESPCACCGQCFFWWDGRGAARCLECDPPQRAARLLLAAVRLRQQHPPRKQRRKKR